MSKHENTGEPETKDIKSVYNKNGSIKKLVIAGTKYKNSGNYEKAKKCFEQILVMDQDDLETIKNLALCYYKEGELGQACLLFERYLKLDENNLEMIITLGHLRITQGQYREAFHWLKKAFLLGEKTTELYNLIGKCCIEINDYSNALNFFTGSLQLNNNQSEVKEIVARIIETDSDGVLAKVDGTKRKIVCEYGEKFSINVFVETGTYLGGMVYAQKDNFRKIYSIELSSKLFRRAAAMFSSFDNIIIKEGDSSLVLPEILNEIQETCLFWLDGHYSAGITAKGDLETPIRKELENIFNHSVRDHVILIDDAGCFNGENDYPTIEQLQEIVFKNRPEYVFEVKDDIIRIHRP